MLSCSPKAYAQCPDRHLCGPIEDATFTESSECAAFNRAVADKPMTNGDRIRAMSDEDLIKKFVVSYINDCPPNRDWECMFGKVADGSCASCWVKWLQSPAAEAFWTAQPQAEGTDTP